MALHAELRENVLYLLLDGRLDTNNAPEIEQQIEKQRAELAHTTAVLDVEKLDYISSAGLRVILRLRKAEPTLSVVNASPEVYDVFEMTGFTEMIPVARAYRHLSVEGCDIIGQGSNGIVYRLDPETIIKVYRNPDCLDDVTKEREISRRAFVLGIPTAIPYDVVKVGESYGSVFELLNAASFSELLNQEPENTDKYIGLYVDLMKSIHAIQVKPGEFPDSHETVRSWVAYLQPHLPEAAWQKLTALAAALPEDWHLIHGDYHVNNVMMQNGEVLLIDMDTLSTGHPIVELASVYNAYKGFGMADPEATQKFFGLSPALAATVWEKTLAMYLGTEDPAKLQEVEDKAILLGCVRLLRRSIRRMDAESEEGRRAVEAYRSMILERIDRVDSFLF